MSSLGHQLPLKPWPARGVLLSCSVRGGFIWGVKRQESCCHSLPLLMLWRVCREANRGTEATFPCSRVMVGEHKTSRMQAVSPHSSRDLNSYWVLCWDVCLCSGNPSYIPWRNRNQVASSLEAKAKSLTCWLEDQGFFCYTVVNSEQLFTYWVNGNMCVWNVGRFFFLASVAFMYLMLSYNQWSVSFTFVMRNKIIFICFKMWALKNLCM